MKRTKTTAAVMAAAMIVGLTACGNSGKGETEKNNSTPTQAAQTGQDDPTPTKGEEAEVTAEPEKKEYEAVDLKGRVIRIGAFYDMYYDSDFRTIDDVDAAGLTYSDANILQKQLDSMHAAEEKWNCKFEWVNLGWDGIQESINTSITAGTPECDIYSCDTQFAYPPVLNGYAEHLKDICPEGADVLTDNLIFSMKDAFGTDDCLFYDTVGYPTGGLYLGYNANMLDNLGLERPEQLAERGEWTWEKFAEYLKVCTQDTDQDGNTDIYGYGSAWNVTIDGFKASNNGFIAATLDETLSDSKVVETFEFIRRLYVEDKTARPIQEVWEDDLYGWATGKVVFGFVQAWQIDGQRANYDFELRICPTPVGPSGDGSMTAPVTHNYYFISKGTKDATSVYCVLEEMMNWFDGDTEWRDDPSYMEACFVDQEQFDLAMELVAKSITDSWNDIDRQTWAVSTIFHSIINGSQSVSQAIEAYHQMLQDELDVYKK